MYDSSRVATMLSFIRLCEPLNDLVQSRPSVQADATSVPPPPETVVQPENDTSVSVPTQHCADEAVSSAVPPSSISISEHTAQEGE
jgi:hypothetical protein